MRRVIIDLGDYYCAYPQLVLTGGAGATVRVHWAESLANSLDAPGKGNRDEIEGKYFDGVGDTFDSDGGRERLFETLWFECGRYVEVAVATRDEPLVIERLTWRQTHYPHRWEDRFESSDPRLAEVVPLMRRVVEMCSHESYMDCPYYEQLMYVGDTRLEVLATYVATRDDRLPRKALEMFDASRVPSGLTQSRYPARIAQVIPPFSLWWVAMVHDYAMWRDDPAFVAARMPGVRAVLDAFRSFVNRDGLVEAPNGWNFVDWVPSWSVGMPSGAERGVSGIINLHTVMALRLAAELEEMLGEPELAARDRRNADAIAAATASAFWDDRRGLFADDLGHAHYSEHAQCLALLGDCVAPDRRDRLIEGLLSAADVARTTIYFSHYLFEAYRLMDRIDLMIERMGLWFGLKANGLRTTIEQPEPTRSDCHAWGSHPLYHYYASILGVRPASPGFKTVHIEPRFGPLKWARGTMTHPRGTIRVDLRNEDGRVTGEIELPPGVTGMFRVEEQVVELREGTRRL